MQPAISAACSWSGGKDSCFALIQAVQQGVIPKILLNMMNEGGQVSRTHGLTANLLQQQADALNLPIVTMPASWQEYERKFLDIIEVIKISYEVEAMIFGDIDLQAHRDWEEMVCGKTGIKAILPLWKKNRKDLLLKMLSDGMEAIIVSCNTLMGQDYLGEKLDLALIPELEARGIDVCGENGEFHTMVINCSMFHNPVSVPPFLKTLHEDYYMLQWPELGV
ncbi:MAG: diphthine--ammonia ligase [Chitinophagaceae bacterium]